MSDDDSIDTPNILATEQGPRGQVYWFRHSAPYIHAYRGRVVVILMPGEVMQQDHFKTIVQDISLLSSLGLKLVLAIGTRPQIEERLAKFNVPAKQHCGFRVTDSQSLPLVLEAVGKTKIELEANLSMGLPNSPMHGADLQVVSGNYVTARPMGVVEGIDLCHTGCVRKVDAEGIQRQLNLGHIVLLTNLGYSATGETFNLACEDVASAAAMALKADKIIILGHEPGIMTREGNLLRQISIDEAELLASENRDKGSSQYRRLRASCKALRKGVGRVHVVSYLRDGALLQELFTRDGVGTLITEQGYDQIRNATISDVGGILILIRELEEKGVLVKRSRELLEREVNNFIVDERDGSVLACVALYPFPDEKIAELACLAVKKKYGRQGRGERLLTVAEQRAQDMGMEALFVLTTQTAHWFIERGFEYAHISQLPIAKQAMFNNERNSKVLIKRLKPE